MPSPLDGTSHLWLSWRSYPTVFRPSSPCFQTSSSQRSFLPALFHAAPLCSSLLCPAISFPEASVSDPLLNELQGGGHSDSWRLVQALLLPTRCPCIEERFSPSLPTITAGVMLVWRKWVFYRPVVGLAEGHMLAGCGLHPLAKLCGFLVYLFLGGPALVVLRFGGSALRDHFCWAWGTP